MPYHRLDGGACCLWAVVDWGAHDPGVPVQSNPPSLHQEIEHRFGSYPARQYIYAFTWPSEERMQCMADSLLQAAKT